MLERPVGLSSLINRNVVVAGRRTSIRLEAQMWDALFEIGRREGRTVHEICTEVDATRRESTLTSGLRMYILGYYREASTPGGHTRAGHGAPRARVSRSVA
jgi:predicted DNA-binding ribbon-helix-helix protein